MNGVRELCRIEGKLYLRDPLTLVFTLMLPVLMFFVLAEVFGNSTADRDEVVFRGIGAIDYYVPAYIALVAAAVGLVSLPVRLASYRERGVFRRLRASGMSVWVLIVAEVAVSLALIIGGAVLVLVIAAVVYRNQMPEHLVGVIAIFVLIAVTFAGVGFLLGAVLPNARTAQGAGAVLFFVMMLLSGAGPPPEVMSGVMRVFADVLPLTHAIRALQDPWLGFSFEWSALAVVLAFLVVSTGLAARCFRWE